MKKLFSLILIIIMALTIGVVNADPSTIATVEPAPIIFEDAPGYISLDFNMFTVSFYKGASGYNKIYDPSGEVVVYEERQNLEYNAGSKWKNRGIPYDLSWVEVNPLQYNVTRHYKDYLGTFYNVTFIIKSGEPIKSVITIDSGQTDEYRLDWQLSGIVYTDESNSENKLSFGDEYNGISFDWSDVYETIGDITETSTESHAQGRKADIVFNIGVVESGERVIIDPATVGTSTTATGTRYGGQRKSFYASGRFWVFYHDGTNVVYESSTDGVAWGGAAVSIGATAGGGRASIAFDGTYVHYTRGTFATTYDVFYRRGIPEANGTITWSAGEQTVDNGVAGDYFDYPTITVDTNGYAWIGAYNDQVGGDDFPVVFKNANNDGTWALDFLFELSAIDDTEWRVIPVALTGGRVYVVYFRDGDPILGRMYDAGWGAEENDLADFDVAFSFRFQVSVIANGDNVSLVYNRETTNQIRHNERVFGVGWNATDNLVRDAVTGVTTMALAYEPNNGTLYCFWLNVTTDHVYFKKFSGGVWDVAFTDWLDESVDDIASELELNSYDMTYGSSIGVCYTTKLAQPFNIRFAFLEIPLPPTIDGLDSDSIISRDVPGWVNVTVSDLNGVANFSRVDIQVNTTGDTENFTLRWTQATGVFSEVSDPSNIVDLDVAGSLRTNINVTTDLISFSFNMTGGAQGLCDVAVFVLDDDGLSDSGTFNNEFEFSFFNWVDEVYDFINSAFSSFGIDGYMTKITVIITSFSTQFDSSLTRIVDLVALQFTVIDEVFNFFFTWSTNMINIVLDFSEFYQSILDGTNPLIQPLVTLGNIWDLIGYDIWADAAPLFIFIIWISSVGTRGKQVVGGEVQVFLNDINTSISLISYFVGIFFLIVDRIISWVYGLFPAVIPGVVTG